MSAASANISKDDLGKLFVGGLSWNTSKESLQSYFEKYGTVSDVIVLKNPMTGTSRGFGFVTFADPSSADTVLAEKPHTIDGKEVDVKQCSAKIHELKRKQKMDNSMKIFVGGIPPGMTNDEIVNAFSRYGPVLDFTMMMDQSKKRSRGFGFLTFEKQESIQRALSDHWITIDGKQVEAKPAQFNVGKIGPAFEPTTGIDYSQWSAWTQSFSPYGAYVPYPGYNQNMVSYPIPAQYMAGTSGYFGGYPGILTPPFDPANPYPRQGSSQQRLQQPQQQQQQLQSQHSYSSSEQEPYPKKARTDSSHYDQSYRSSSSGTTTLQMSVGCRVPRYQDEDFLARNFFSSYLRTAGYYYGR